MRENQPQGRVRPVGHLGDPAWLVERKGLVTPIAPLVLQEHDAFVHFQLSADVRLLVFLLQEWGVDIRASLGGAFENDDLAVWIPVDAIGVENTLDRTRARMHEGENLLARMGLGGGQSGIARLLRGGHEAFEEIFLPGSGHGNRLSIRLAPRLHFVLNPS